MHALPGLVALDLALSALAAALGAAGSGLGFRQHQRLALWLVAPMGAIQGLGRVAGPAVAELTLTAVAAFGVLIAHAWLWRALRRGLGSAG